MCRGARSECGANRRGAWVISLAAMSFGAVGAASGCGRESTLPAPVIQDGTVVAVVVGESILVEELGELGRFTDPQSRRTAVQGAIGDRLAVQEARRRGLDRKPEVQRAIVRLRREAAQRERGLLRRALAADMGRDLMFADADLKAAFDARPARYAERRITLRRQRFETRAAALEADRALGRAGRVEEAGAEQVGPVAESELPKEWGVDLRRFRKPGDRRVVEAGGAAWLVELVNDAPHQPQSFREVRAQVQRDLRVERARAVFAAELDRLRAGARVEIEDGVLADDRNWAERGAVAAQ
jgi:hypothetical protein